MASAPRIRHSRNNVLGRTSKLVLAAGFAIVLALAIALVQLTRPATQAATLQPPDHGSTATSQPPAEPPASRTAPTGREDRPGPGAPREHVAMPGARPELAPVRVSFARELKRDANGKLVPMIPVGLLREQFHRTDAAMTACIERSAQRPTGKATLSFTVAAKNSKLIIETTGVHDEETLAGYPELLECMHRTANELVLDGRAVPELGTPIYVRRHVRLDNGVLAENSIFNFSYNP